MALMINGKMRLYNGRNPSGAPRIIASSLVTLSLLLAWANCRVAQSFAKGYVDTSSEDNLSPGYRVCWKELRLNGASSSLKVLPSVHGWVEL